jgi:hypothetical protein
MPGSIPAPNSGLYVEIKIKGSQMAEPTKKTFFFNLPFIFYLQVSPNTMMMSGGRRRSLSHSDENSMASHESKNKYLKSFCFPHILVVNPINGNFVFKKVLISLKLLDNE